MRRVRSHSPDLDFFLRTKFVWPASAVMVLKDAVVPRKVMGQELNNAAKTLKHFPSGDIYYTCLLNSRGQYGFLAEPLMRYRQHRGQSVNSAHLVRSELDLIKAFKRAYLWEPTIRAQWVGVEISFLRCRVYSMLMHAHELTWIPVLKNQISRLRRTWETNVPPGMRLHDAILPYEILLNLLGMESSLLSTADPLSGLPPIQDPCPRAFRAWLTRLHNGRGMFSERFPHRRVAILGSAFVAYLLVLEAQRIGIEVVCCLESKTYRHNDKVLGVPIVPHEWLQKHAADVDAVILSSERNHEEWLESLVRTECKGRSLPVLSWKKLVS
jgi:hypothetical protein